MMKKLNNKGISLVELVIGIAISAIVISILAMMMATSSNNYRTTSAEVSLQSEAQTILNQLETLVMEAYNVKYDSASGQLTIYQNDADYKITLKSDHKLYFVKTPKPGTAGSEELFGEYVDSFSVVDTGSGNQNKTIKISLTLQNGTKTYHVDNSLITLRNKIKTVNSRKAVQYERV